MAIQHDVNRDVYGNVTHISSSDGTETRPIRDIYGNITGFETTEKDSGYSQIGAELASSWFDKLIKFVLKFYLVTTLIVLGLGLIVILIALIISHTTGTDVATVLNDAFDALLKIVRFFY